MVKKFVPGKVFRIIKVRHWRYRNVIKGEACGTELAVLELALATVRPVTAIILSREPRADIEEARAYRKSKGESVG